MDVNKIIQGCKAQDFKSQRLLYDHFSKRMFPVCLRYCKDQQSAAIALQNGFIKIFKSIASLKDDNKIEAWMRRIIVHASLDQLKSDKKFAFVEVNEEHMNVTDHYTVDNDIMEKVLPLLDLLPDGYKMVFSMRVLEDFSHKEIAKSLGISESTSRSQLAKARKMLKKIVAQKHVIL